MDKDLDKIQKEINFFTKKLPLPKLEEVLDYIKWLWINIGKEKGQNIRQAISKIREIQSKHKAQEGWDSITEVRKWRESH